MSKRLLLLLVFLFTHSISILRAQEGGVLPGEGLGDEKIRPVQVTATIKDDDAPSTPILISPENNSIVTTSTPTFIWKGSTDSYSGVKYYVLYLDGEILYTNIPTTDTEHADYTLTYASGTQYYSLTPDDGISDGTHTWKILAFDYYNNNASSVTWSFTIDTQVPTFVITDIGSVAVTISAQDLTTIPNDPVSLSENEPLLIGTGEANSDVSLTITLLDGTTSSYTFTIAADGTWELQLGLLPRDEVISLDFLITDVAGHISVLNDVELIIPTQTTVVDVPFVPDTVVPPIIVKVIPIKEVIPGIVETVTRPLPRSVQKLTAAFPFYYPTPQKPPFSLLNFLVLVVISFLPMLKTVLLSLDFGTSFSIKIFAEIWHAIGFFPWGNPQGIVVDQKTKQALPYARVILSRTDDHLNPVTIIKLTNKHGVFMHVALEKGRYEISVHHPAITFPSLVQAPPHLTWNFYYQGQEYALLERDSLPALVIPVDILSKPVAWYKKVKLWLLNRTMASFKLWTLCLMIVMVFPTLLNIGGIISYSLILVFLYLRKHQTIVHGTFVTQQKTPITQSIVFLIGKDISQIKDIRQTDKQGRFTLHGNRQSQAVAIIDFKYQSAEQTVQRNQLALPNPPKHNQHLPIIGIAVSDTQSV